MLKISYFVHPLPLLAVGLLILNDHYLKWHYPSIWTGKLSDFAGLFFFPLFLCAVFNLVRNLGSRLIGSPKFYWITALQLFSAILIADCIFIGINLHSGIARFYINLVEMLGFKAVVTMDKTDLIALIMNIPTWKFGRRLFKILPE